jgi:rhodanese-related sulfurtransferase
MLRYLAAIVVVTASFPVFACDQQATIAQVTVNELVSLRKAKAVTVLDADDAATRAKIGMIPGAILLSSFDKYELSQLPKSKDSKLVFYCANTRCTASQAAAERAVAAGYTDVAVLPPGIQGWADAGQATRRLSQS